MIDEISLLAEEALKIQKRIKEDTIKLRKIKDKLITTDEEMSDFCKVPLWKHEII